VVKKKGGKKNNIERMRGALPLLLATQVSSLLWRRTRRRALTSHNA